MIRTARLSAWLTACALIACGDNAGDDGAAGTAGTIDAVKGSDASVFGNPNVVTVDAASGNPSVPDASTMEGPPEPGRCAPREGPDMEALQQQGALEAVVEDGGYVVSSLVYEGYLYVTRGGIGLERYPEGGGPSELLIANDAMQVSLLGFDAGYLYFKPADTPLARVPVDDWSATPEEQGGTARGIARKVVGSYLYGFGPDPQELWRQDFATGTLDVLATLDDAIGGLDVADGYVYYTDNTFGAEGLYRVPDDGGTVEQLASSFNFFDLQDVRVLGANVYFADGYRMYVTDPTIADPTTSTESLGGYGPDSGGCSTCNGTRGGGGFVERGDRIYWIDDAGNAGWTSKDRTECGAVYIQGSSLFPEAMQVGADHLYVFPDFPSSGSKIWRTPL